MTVLKRERDVPQVVATMPYRSAAAPPDVDDVTELLREVRAEVRRDRLVQRLARIEAALIEPPPFAPPVAPSVEPSPASEGNGDVVLELAVGVAVDALGDVCDDALADASDADGDADADYGLFLIGATAALVAAYHWYTWFLHFPSLAAARVVTEWQLFGGARNRCAASIGLAISGLAGTAWILVVDGDAALLALVCVPLVIVGLRLVHVRREWMKSDREAPAF